MIRRSRFARMSVLALGTTLASVVGLRDIGENASSPLARVQATQCAWTSVSQAPLRLAGGPGEVVLDVTSSAVNEEGVVGVGAVSALHWHPPVEPGGPPVTRAPWIGGILTAGDSIIPIPSPLPSEAPTSVQILPDPSGGWQIIAIFAHRDSIPSGPDKVGSVWEGLFAEGVWQRFGEVEFGGHPGEPYPFGSVVWRSGSGGAALALLVAAPGQLAPTGIRLLRQTSAASPEWEVTQVDVPGSLSTMAHGFGPGGGEYLFIPHIGLLGDELRNLVSAIPANDRGDPVLVAVLPPTITQSIPDLWALSSSGGSEIVWFQPSGGRGSSELEARWVHFDSQQPPSNGRSVGLHPRDATFVLDRNSNPLSVSLEVPSAGSERAMFRFRGLSPSGDVSEDRGGIETPTRYFGFHLIQPAPDSLILITVVGDGSNLVSYIDRVVDRCQS